MLNLRLRLFLMMYALQGGNKMSGKMAAVKPQRFRLYNSETVQRARKLLKFAPASMHEVKEVDIPSFDGQMIRLRIYCPTTEQNLPVLVYFHGGGFVIGSIDTHDNECRTLAKKTNCIVVSVDYRLAPEYQYPTAPKDCYEATLWVQQNITNYGGDPSRIAVGGDSAGGNLATVVTMMARDNEHHPKICYQVLIYPVTDATMGCASIQLRAKGYLLTKELMSWFISHYAGKEQSLKEAYLSPLWAENLKNLPPAYVATAEYDPLRDEGIKYAQKLKENGIEVIHRDFKGVIHAFFSMPKLLKAARELEDEIATLLKKAFASS